MRLRVVFATAALVMCGCMKGPKYSRPAAPVPTAFKEAPPAGWKEASPSDELIRGKWWEVYGDPALNALEEQVAISNQNVLAAEANYRVARAAVRVARSALFPTVGTSPSITASGSGRAGSRGGTNASTNASSSGNSVNMN